MTSPAYGSPFEASMREAQAWIADVARETGLDDDRGLIALRAVLHALRDQMTPRHNGDFAAQMPAFVRGLFFEGWDPSDAHPVHYDPRGFLARVRAQLGRNGPQLDPTQVTRAVLRVVERRMPEPTARLGRLLPHAVRSLWSPTIAAELVERGRHVSIEHRMAAAGTRA